MKARGSSKGCSMGISTGKQCPWQAVGCSCSRDDVGQATDLGRRTLLTPEGSPQGKTEHGCLSPCDSMYGGRPGPKSLSLLIISIRDLQHLLRLLVLGPHHLPCLAYEGTEGVQQTRSGLATLLPVLPNTVPSVMSALTPTYALLLLF